jgi:hypothetical protein
MTGALQTGPQLTTKGMGAEKPLFVSAGDPATAWISTA